jgi:hypothetical protein|tara:strand:- start:5098 stop:5322 length:225 start_codon:yes stop_codon:yes gene_type:complete
MSLLGNLLATSCVGLAVFLALQWRPDPHEDWTVMAAVTLAYVGGLLTALSSLSGISIRPVFEEGNSPDNNDGKH